MGKREKKTKEMKESRIESNEQYEVENARTGKAEKKRETKLKHFQI